MLPAVLQLLLLASAGSSGDVLHLQVLLDRAHFSPGEIDGKEGSNTRRATQAFQRSRGLEATGVPTEETWIAPFFYNPDLFWDADEHHAKVKLPPGPNSPVGVVWIDLSKEHYGIHGTPEPANVGKTQSHGCIRLTNWDAAELASLVAEGTPAVLVSEAR
jgi:lipoprotein-anchoring transpeptidase ErfK/SrfK